MALWSIFKLLLVVGFIDRGGYVTSDIYDTSYRCTDGQYISSRFFCDGVGGTHCKDGSDEMPEMGCGLSKKKCLEDGKKFTCNSGQCVSPDVICDTIQNCKDGSDELNCGNQLNVNNCSLLDGNFLCHDKKRCLNFKFQCDGFCNCFDCSDENSTKCDEDGIQSHYNFTEHESHSSTNYLSNLYVIEIYTQSSGQNDDEFISASDEWNSLSGSLDTRLSSDEYTTTSDEWNSPSGSSDTQSSSDEYTTTSDKWNSSSGSSDTQLSSDAFTTTSDKWNSPSGSLDTRLSADQFTTTSDEWNSQSVSSDTRSSSDEYTTTSDEWNSPSGSSDTQSSSDEYTTTSDKWNSPSGSSDTQSSSDEYTTTSDKWNSPSESSDTRSSSTQRSELEESSPPKEPFGVFTPIVLIAFAVTFLLVVLAGFYTFKKFFNTRNYDVSNAEKSKGCSITLENFGTHMFI